MSEIRLRSLWLSTVLAVIGIVWISTANAQTRACDLFPLRSGEANAYSVFTTDTNGVAISSTETKATSLVASQAATFYGYHDVALVVDTTLPAPSASTTTVSDVHYSVTNAGDVRAFADQNFLALFAPKNIAQSLVPPDSFVNYLVMSEGDRTYPILTIDQDVPYSTMTIAVHVELGGRFQGVESIVVPGGKFDNAYHFTIGAVATGAVKGSVLMKMHTAQELWLVPGIGVVKSNMPTVANGLVQMNGSQRLLTKHWVNSTASVLPSIASQRSLTVFPNPVQAGGIVTIEQQASEPSTLEVVNELGAVVRTITTERNNTEFEFSTMSFAPGVYTLVRINSSATSNICRFVVSR